MSLSNLKAWWYESIPIDLLETFDVPADKTGGVKTGGMKPDEWDPLIQSLKEEGMVNPIMVEDDNTSFKVAIGNNRVWGMKALGETTIKAVVMTRGKQEINMPPGGIPIPNHLFAYQMGKLHPRDETWKKSIYATKITKSVLQVEGEI